jgi:hypothetical protein
MDEADAADVTREQALKAALNRRMATLPVTGRCYNCKAPVDGIHKFCDANCRIDWEREQKAHRLNGRVEG